VSEGRSEGGNEREGRNQVGRDGAGDSWAAQVSGGVRGKWQVAESEARHQAGRGFGVLQVDSR
jgi:hypothetical protein